jgi:predicted nucleotidyltransferase
MGFTEETFQDFSQRIRSAVQNKGYPTEDLRVHGSRVTRTAKPFSDIDVAIRVDRATFERILAERFGSPKVDTAKWRTMQHALSTGKIQRGELSLRGEARDLEAELGFEVDISVILIDGPFDSGPWLPLR